MPTQRNNYASESGNIFLMIIIGIVLFAALMFTLTRGMNESPTNVSDRQAKLTASDLLTYGQRMERGVARLFRNGCSENDISFEHGGAGGSDYVHSPVAEDKCKLFHASGGKVSYTSLADGVNNEYFTGSNEVDGVGNATACGSGTACTDLIALYEVDGNVCEQVNRALKIGPFAEPGTLSTTKFTGDFTYADIISGASGEATACVTNGGNSYVYMTLFAR